MSDLETRISQLERELALKKGYQAVKFVLPKSLPDDVATEIQSKLREIAESMALTKDQLTSDDTPTTATEILTNEEVLTLKMVAASVLKRTASSSEASATVLNGAAMPTYTPPVQKPPGNPKKAKILVAENIRGEARKYASPDDELHVPNPDKLDENGMVSAVHIRRGGMMKIPLDDIEILS